MATLDSSFNDDLADAVLDDVEATLVGTGGGEDLDGLVGEFVDRVHDILRNWGAAMDYNVEPIIDSFELAAVQRTDRSLTVRLGWTHEASVYLEFGTSDHTIEGQPILSFVWEERHDPPDWVAEEFEAEGDGYRVFLPEVEVAGIEKVRQVRTALRWFRGELRA